MTATPCWHCAGTGWSTHVPKRDESGRVVEYIPKPCDECDGSGKAKVIKLVQPEVRT